MDSMTAEQIIEVAERILMAISEVLRENNLEPRDVFQNAI
jgi:hypothetical protein